MHGELSQRKLYRLAICRFYGSEYRRIGRGARSDQIYFAHMNGPREINGIGPAVVWARHYYFSYRFVVQVRESALISSPKSSELFGSGEKFGKVTPLATGSTAFEDSRSKVGSGL